MPDAQTDDQGDDSLTQLKTAVHQLAEGSQGLYDGIVKYNEGVSGINDGASQLHEGIKKLDSAGGELTEGYDDLQEGTKKLHEGFEEFDKEGIQEITKTADEDLKDLLDRIKTMKAADALYNNFSGITEGKSSEVRFIIETAEIKP
jgi:putative membrane protein